MRDGFHDDEIFWGDHGNLNIAHDHDRSAVDRIGIKGQPANRQIHPDSTGLVFQEKNSGATGERNGIRDSWSKPMGHCHFQKMIERFFVEAKQGIHVFRRSCLP